MDAAGVIAHYVMDGDQALSAESAGNTTFYLYGLGAIGEKTTEWSFSLPDGTNTPRQLTDLQGEVTLSARYTPWGDSLQLHGAGNFSFGYLGGVLDATTGLLYVGNGQYYDPETGRFLTRDAKPNSSNPYVPWDPIGAIVGPLAAIALFFGKKRKRGKWDSITILVVLTLSAGLGLAACQFTAGGYNITATPSPAQPDSYNVTVTPTTVPPSTPTSIGTPTPQITYTCTVTPIPTGNLNLYFASLPEPYAKMPGQWTISEAGIEFLKKWEGKDERMYNDGDPVDSPLRHNRSGQGSGHCTIGHGHLVHRGPCGLENYREVEKYWADREPLSPAEMDAIMRTEDIPIYENIIREHVKVKVTQTQFDALVSLVYNWGEDNFVGSATKLPLLNSGQYVAVADDFLRGPIESNGVELDSLKKRRAEEREMFLRLVDIPYSQVSCP